MEKLRAKWIKQMKAEHQRFTTTEEFYDQIESSVRIELYEQVLRDSEWFNEEFSKLLAEVTEGVQSAKQGRDEAHRNGDDLEREAQIEKKDVLQRIKEKLERLEQGKEVTR